MMTIDYKYWDDFYSSWDKIVKEWYEGQEKNQIDSISNEYSAWIKDLNLHELPTPYLGNPNDGVEAVIIDLNPGGSELIGFGKFEGEHADATQDYSNIENDIGWLIRKFRDYAGKSYRRFVEKWSCLNPNLRGNDPWVCGVNWWQGYTRGIETYEGKDRVLIEYHKDSNTKCRGHRIEWARRIYKNPWMSPAKVFALELCPFHSKEFNAKFNVNSCRDELIGFIKKHVLDAVVKATHEGNLPFALGVGSHIGDVLQVLGAELKDRWSHEQHPDAWNWPRWDHGAKRGQLRNRTYSLFTIQSTDGIQGRVLVTSAPGGLSCPAPDFWGVEDCIREFALKN